MQTHLVFATLALSLCPAVVFVPAALPLVPATVAKQHVTSRVLHLVREFQTKAIREVVAVRFCTGRFVAVGKILSGPWNFPGILFGHVLLQALVVGVRCGLVVVVCRFEGKLEGGRERRRERRVSKIEGEEERKGRGGEGVSKKRKRNVKCF